MIAFALGGAALTGRADQPPPPLLPEGADARNPEKVWRRLEGAGFSLDIYRSGANTVTYFGEATLHKPNLYMRLTRGSGQVTSLLEMRTAIRGEITELESGRKAVIIAQTDTGLELTETFTVASNRLEISVSAKSNWLIVKGSHPVWLGGISFGSPHAPITVVGRRGDISVDKLCQDAASLELNHRGKLIRIEFGGPARAYVQTGRSDGRYCHINFFPLAVINTIPPGGTIGYEMTINVVSERK